MSKIDELREKYNSVTKASFDKFANSDKTPTKKYLEFMLKTWENRKTSNTHRTVSEVIRVVTKFDELLPYIENKDIYSNNYNSFVHLKRTIEKAEEVKDEKTFKREEHVTVLMENYDFLLVLPKTHKGSLKYGYGTRWCTASKHSPQTFINYHKNGYLVYLIDKTNKVEDRYKKIAFYISKNSDIINCSINMYNTNDTCVGEKDVVKGGWEFETLFEIITTIRFYTMKIKDVEVSQNYVDSFIKTIEKINFEELEKHIKKLEQTTNTDYISKVKETALSFVEKIKDNKLYGI